jgi:hypothetical protein
MILESQNIGTTEHKDKRTPKDPIFYFSPNTGLQNKTGHCDIFINLQKTREKKTQYGEFLLRLITLNIKKIILIINY